MYRILLGSYGNLAYTYYAEVMYHFAMSKRMGKHLDIEIENGMIQHGLFYLPKGYSGLGVSGEGTETELHRD